MSQNHFRYTVKVFSARDYPWYEWHLWAETRIPGSFGEVDRVHLTKGLALTRWGARKKAERMANRYRKGKVGQDTKVWTFIV